MPSAVRSGMPPGEFETLLLDIPVDMAHCFEALMMDLLAMHGISNANLDRTTSREGKYYLAQVQGSATALDDAHCRLDRALQYRICVAGYEAGSLVEPMRCDETAMLDRCIC